MKFFEIQKKSYFSDILNMKVLLNRYFTEKRAVILCITMMSALFVPFCGLAGEISTCILAVMASLQRDLKTAGNHGQVHAARLHPSSVIYSKEIPANQLGYKTGLRNPSTLSAETLYQRMKVIPEVTDIQITSTIVTSDLKSAENGVVRLAYLKDGRPVVVKTLMKDSIDPLKQMHEAKGAFLLSELGIFPTFHGIYKADGNFSLVMDIFPGDLFLGPQMPSLHFLKQYAEVIKRFSAVNINRLPDQEILFQVMKSAQDEISVIDADGFYEVFIRGNPQLRAHWKRPNWQARDYDEFQQLSNEQAEFDEKQIKSIPRFSWGKQLASLVLSAKEDDAAQFLVELKADAGGILWQYTVQELRNEVDLWKRPVSEKVKALIYGTKK
ncbi:MAG TPA: hypothetical protein VI754_05200 [Bacteriovoracaceae bacterium]|nr:hypothetical protein [Bacteriovoracaceae bacterium]